MKHPAIIYWEGPGYYYFNNGWKRSCDQNRFTENEDRKYFSSQKKARNLGLAIAQ